MPSVEWTHSLLRSTQKTNQNSWIELLHKSSKIADCIMTAVISTNYITYEDVASIEYSNTKQPCPFTFLYNMVFIGMGGRYEFVMSYTKYNIRNKRRFNHFNQMAKNWIKYSTVWPIFYWTRWKLLDLILKHSKELVSECVFLLSNF